MRNSIGVLLSLTALLLFFAPANALAGEVVSLNKATVEELMAIEAVGIPEKLAKAIVEYREANGPFKTPEDLLKVPGMTNDFWEDLNPIVKNGDVVYDPDAEPVLAPSKC